MVFARVLAMATMAAALLAAALGGSTNAQTNATASSGTAPATNAYSPIARTSARTWKAGLWDKPNQACVDRCEVFVNKGCFTELSKKNPTADAASLQAQCEDKFSLCLYKCMCDTCDENQIIVKEP